MTYTVQHRASFHAVCTTHPGDKREWTDAGSFESREQAEAGACALERKHWCPSGRGMDVRVVEQP